MIPIQDSQADFSQYPKSNKKIDRLSGDLDIPDHLDDVVTADQNDFSFGDPQLQSGNQGKLISNFLDQTIK